MRRKGKNYHSFVCFCEVIKTDIVFFVIQNKKLPKLWFFVVHFHGIELTYLDESGIFTM